MKIVAINAGLSEESSTRLLAQRLGRATGAQDVEHIELRALAHDLVNALLTRMQSPALEQAVSHVVDADALVVVSPVYNGSMSGLFKMFFDVLHEGALLDKPTLLAATGGTDRHSLAIDQSMLPMFFYLKAAIAPTAVFAATSDWGGDPGKLEQRIERAAGELVAMARIRLGQEQPEALAEAAEEGVRPAESRASRGARQAKAASAGDFTLTKSFQEMFDAI